jgi:ribonuclease HI
MNKNKIHIYSDASFSKQNQIGVAGFLLFEDDDSHQIAAPSVPIQTKIFKEKNNIRAELSGVIFAIEALPDKLHDRLQQTDTAMAVEGRRINLYTDCQSIVRLLDRRKRLESSNFIAMRSRKPLSNADLYKRFYTVYDKLPLNLIWVKGHTLKRDRDLIQKNFSRVDKVVRKILRSSSKISHVKCCRSQSPV